MLGPTILTSGMAAKLRAQNDARIQANAIAQMNSLAQYQQQSLQCQSALQQFGALASAAMNTHRHDPSASYLRSRAEGYADDGEKIIDRIAFWSTFLPLSTPILSKLADELDVATNETERFLKMAEAA